MKGITTFYLIVFIGIIQMQVLFGGFGLFNASFMESLSISNTPENIGEKKKTNKSQYQEAANQNDLIFQIEFIGYGTQELKVTNTRDIQSVFDPGLF